MNKCDIADLAAQIGDLPQDFHDSGVLGKDVLMALCDHVQDMEILNYPHLAENGLFILDDVHIPTIAQLDRFIREDEMFEHLATVGTTSFHRRTSAPTFDPYGDGWWEQNYNTRRFERLKARYYRPTLKTRIYNLMAEKFGENFAEGTRKTYRRVASKRDR